MANNRIYLRCKQCGEKLFLGKHCMTAYYWSNYSNGDKHLEDYLNEFFDKHCWCENEINEQSLSAVDTPLGKYTSWDTIFEIAYEIDDGWE